jgi:hypothetical protein
MRYQPNIDVRWREPREIKEVAVWLDSSEYRSAAIVLTEMRWESSHLALYVPGVFSRSLIVWPLVSDKVITEFVERAKPGLFITRDGDETDRDRVEVALRRAGRRSGEVLYAAGDVKVYRIEGRPGD